MNFWNDRPVLVTGATGLLGSWLTKELVEQGASLTVLVRDYDSQSELIRNGLIQHVHVITGCLEDLSTLERAIAEYEIKTIFHLGAQTIVDTALRAPLATFEANIRGTYHLLEAARRQRTLVEGIVIASSDKAYGDSPILPYTEAMPLAGCHPYDVSKSCADLIALTYAHTYKLPIVITRCGNLFGGGDLNWSRLIPGTIRSFYLKRAPEIRSNGTYTRDYLYVKDAVHAYLLAAQSVCREEIAGQAFNFGPNRPYSVLEIVAMIQKLMDVQVQPKILNKAQNEILHQSLDSAKARQFLGWKPHYSLESGLMETIQWYNEYLESHSRKEVSLIKKVRETAVIYETCREFLTESKKLPIP